MATFMKQYSKTSMQRIAHPRSTQLFIGPLLELAGSNDMFTVFSFIQYVRPNPDSVYHFYITNTKLYKPNDSLISITHQAYHLDNVCLQLLRMLEQDRFYSENYPGFASLTRREKELLRYIANGYTNEEIAD